MKVKYNDYFYNTKNNLINYLSELNIPNIKDVYDLTEIYSDFYISDVKDRKQNFRLLGTLKKIKGEKRNKTISIYNFGSKQLKEYNSKYTTKEIDIMIEKKKLELELFCINFKNFRRFEEIKENNRKIEKVSKKISDI